MELFQIMTDISGAIDAAGNANASNLIEGNFAKRILGTVAGLEIAWTLGMILIDDDGFAEGVARCIRTIVIALICLFAISNWSFVTKDITETSASIVQKVGKGQDLGGVISDSLGSAFRYAKTEQLFTDPSAKDSWVTQLVNDFTFSAYIDRVLSIVIRGFTGGVVGAVAAIAIFIILLGKIALWISVIFGPLCVAFAPLKLTRKITESWFSYTFAAIMFPAVAAAVLLLSGGIFTALNTLTDKANVTEFPSTIYSIAAIAMAAVAGFMMLQVPKITAALFGSIGIDAPHMPSMRRAPNKPGK